MTGLPVDYYVITGFPGLMQMVDELGGVDVLVDRRMNDKNSGARFQRGWQHFTGGQALAFARDRTDVERGDFTRSEHQGLIIMSALAKMRGEVGDDAGVARWIGVLVRHAKLDVPLSRLPALGALARRLDPARLTNVVAPGRIGTTAGQSVVFLTTDAARLFEDLRPDAVVGGTEPVLAAPTTTTAPTAAASPATTSSSSSSSSSSSTSTTLGRSLFSTSSSSSSSSTSTTATSPTGTAPNPDDRGRRSHHR